MNRFSGFKDLLIKTVTCFVHEQISVIAQIKSIQWMIQGLTYKDCHLFYSYMNQCVLMNWLDELLNDSFIAFWKATQPIKFKNKKCIILTNVSRAIILICLGATFLTKQVHWKGLLTQKWKLCLLVVPNVFHSWGEKYYESQWGPETVWLPTCFKTNSILRSQSIKASSVKFSKNEQWTRLQSLKKMSTGTDLKGSWFQW